MVLEAWRQADPNFQLRSSDELKEFLTVMELKRICAQVDYTTRKLRGSKLALQGKARLVRILFYTLVFLILILSAVLGVLRAFKLDTAVPIAAVALGSLSAGLIALQM